MSNKYRLALSQSLLISGERSLQKLWQDQSNPFWLPDDVVHLILGYLDTHQLEQCTHVCRSWRCIAQPMLFDLVTVNAAPAPPRIMNFFSVHTRRDFPSFILANPGRGLLFKHLKYTTPSNDAASLYAVMPYCSLLRSLTLSCALAPPFLQHVSLQQFPLLRTLVLTEISAFRIVVDCFRFVSAELLEELSLSLAKSYTERSVDVPQRQPCLPAIRTFSLFNDNESPFASFSLLLDYLFPILLRLRRLVAHTIHFHSPDILRLVEANEGTLKYLDSSEVLGPSDLLPRLLNHGVLQEITLCLPVLPNILGRYLSDLGTMFLNLNLDNSPLRRVSFVVSSTYGLLDLGQHSDLWAQLAGILSRAPYLEMVTLLLEVPPWGQSSMFVTKNDLSVHPAFDVLRQVGRIEVIYRPSPGRKPSVILPSEFVASL
ncbi:hypothetical protein DFH05DRAFT_1525154 [Lentinula detonsa]|uniref:F-box domain-containing protein n=1 Tax=Lentinula detonsa TaxID=2804962 RepID=A0A9W8NZR2_9AGAR|nr:hypothetical protein DFH05DRAFT_1525154 [Lentinula detonsa]